MSALCISCGNWKQVPMSRCPCGFAPVRGSLDQAKSYLLTPQFRAPEELEVAARAIRAGEAVAYPEAELEVAMRIGRWNAAVTLAFLAAAVLLGLLLGSVAARMPLAFLAAVGVLAAIAFSAAFKLMGHVDRKVARR
jgi:hypothetical protein